MKTYTLLRYEHESLFKAGVDISHHCSVSMAGICNSTTFFKYCIHETCLVDGELQMSPSNIWCHLIAC